LRGRGVGQALVERAVLDARLEGFRIIPLCPFAKAQFERHPAWRDVVCDLSDSGRPPAAPESHFL
jgi:predicted GNAT family acetyltransferase